jgi:hypothetical protein
MSYFMVAYHKHGKSYLTLVDGMPRLGCKKIAEKYPSVDDAEAAAIHLKDFRFMYSDIKIKSYMIEDENGNVA